MKTPSLRILQLTKCRNKGEMEGGWLEGHVPRVRAEAQAIMPVVGADVADDEVRLAAAIVLHTIDIGLGGAVALEKDVLAVRHPRGIALRGRTAGELHHLTTVDAIGTQPPLMPMPNMMPKSKYSCQRLSIWDINKRPKPNIKPQIVTTSLGPNLSVSLPATKVRKPLEIILAE